MVIRIKTLPAAVQVPPCLIPKKVFSPFIVKQFQKKTARFLFEYFRLRMESFSLQLGGGADSPVSWLGTGRRSPGGCDNASSDLCCHISLAQTLNQ